MDILGIIELPWYIIAIGILIINTGIAYMYFTWRFNELRDLGIKHPKPFPVVGNMLPLFTQGVRNGEVELVRQNGKLFGLYEGRNPMIVVADPDMLKQIMVKDFSSFINRRKQELQADILKLSLADVNGDHWRHIRSYVSPTFSSGKMRLMSPLLKLAGDHLLENLARHEKEGRDVDIKKLCINFTMEVTGSAAFGLQLDTQQEEVHPFLVNAKRIFELKFTNIAILVTFFVPCLVPILDFFGACVVDRKAVDFFVKAVEKTLNDRRKVPTDRPDFLKLMVDAERDTTKGEDVLSEGDKLIVNKEYRKERGLTTPEITAQSVLFMLVGYETTGNTLQLLLYNLAVHPECQDKVIAEVDQHMPDGEEPSYDNVSKLTYMDQCINETLRLYPPANRTERITLCDTVINGVKFPKGMLVTIPILALHKDPEVWPDPELFDPDRFTPEAKANRHPFCFMPFGMGPRNCVGMRLAEMELKIATAMILQKFKFVKSDKTQVPLKIKKDAFFADPDQPIFLRVQTRSC